MRKALRNVGWLAVSVAVAMVVVVITQTEGQVTLEGAKAGKQALLSEWKERMASLLGEGAPRHKETNFVTTVAEDESPVDKAVAAAMKKAAASKTAIVSGTRLGKLTQTVANEKNTKVKTKKAKQAKKKAAKTAEAAAKNAAKKKKAAAAAAAKKKAAAKSVAKKKQTLAVEGAQKAAKKAASHDKAHAVSKVKGQYKKVVASLEAKHAAAQTAAAKKLAALRKKWKMKQALALKTMNKKAAQQGAKLAKDMKKEKAAKLNIIKIKSQKNKEQLLIRKQNKGLSAAQATIKTMRTQLSDMQNKFKHKAKKAAHAVKKAAHTQLAKVANKYQSVIQKLKAKLKQEHQREESIVKQVVIDRKSKHTAKSKMALATKQAADAKTLVASFQKKVSKALEAAKKEKTLRVKAVATAIKLGQKVSKMGAFGKKAAAYAKKKALQAQKAMVDAHDQVAKVNARKVAAKEGLAKMHAKKKKVEAKLASEASKRAQAEAKAAHQKAVRGHMNAKMAQIQAKLKHMQHKYVKKATEAAKRKLSEKKLAAEASKRKHAEKKALKTFKKVGDIRKAYDIAQKTAEHYRNENKLQRIALARAAAQEEVAAKATKAAAIHATEIEKQALVERNTYQTLIKKAQVQLKAEHSGKIGAKKAASSLMKKAKSQLLAEHALRLKAEAKQEQLRQAALASEHAAQQEHEVMLKIKAAAAKIAAERGRLDQRQKAASAMIAVEHEAEQQAEKSAKDLREADQRQMTKLTSDFQSKLKDEHDKSLKSQTDASAMAARIKNMKEAIAHERLILKEEQTKAENERKSWKNAIDAFKKEQKARALAKGAADESTKATTEKAQLEINKAQKLAKSKDSLLKQLKSQIMSEAGKFKKAANDWQLVKAQLQARAQTAEAAAHDANNKLASLAKQQSQDATAAGAKSAVVAAMKKAEASVAPKKTKLLTQPHTKTEAKPSTVMKPMDAPVHHMALTELSENFQDDDDW